MIIKAIVKAIKAIVDVVTKVIAWLLIALGLWIPLVYSLLFVIVVVLFTDAQLASLGTLYFFGLFVSFVGALWFSMKRSAKKIKNRKTKKLSHNVSEVQKKTDEAVIVKDEQPPTIKNENETRMTAIDEDAEPEKNKSEKDDTEEARKVERVEQPKPQDMRAPEPQSPWNEPQDRRAPEQQSSWNEPQARRAPEQQSSWNEPQNRRAPEPQPWNEPTYNEPRAQAYDRPVDNGWSDRRREPRSQWNAYDNPQYNEPTYSEPQNPQRTQSWDEPQGRSRASEPRNPWDEPTYNEPRSQAYDRPVDNGWGDRRREPTPFDNTDFNPQFDTQPQRNQWEPQDQWGRQNASDPYRNQPAPEPEFNRYDRAPQNNDMGQRAPESMDIYERPLADEKPKVFKLRSEPGVLVYEYSDRLDYYRCRPEGGPREFLRRKFKN